MTDKQPELNELQKFSDLIYNVFELNPLGKELLSILTDSYHESQSFPANKSMIDSHGGVLAYLAYKDGQRHFLRTIHSVLKRKKGELNQPAIKEVK